MEFTLRHKFEEIINDGTLSNNDKLTIILKDTIEYFTKHPRCKKGDTCVYDSRTINLEGETEGCAIGRMFTANTQKEMDENYPELSFARIHHDEAETLPTFMVTYGRFFERLQTLHDKDIYWSGGLNEKGKSYIENYFGDLSL